MSSCSAPQRSSACSEQLRQHEPERACSELPTERACSAQQLLQQHHEPVLVAICISPTTCFIDTHNADNHRLASLRGL
jgi:hypothetical protein